MQYSVLPCTLGCLLWSEQPCKLLRCNGITKELLLSTALQCTTLHCILLHCTALSCFTLNCTELGFTVLRWVVLDCVYCTLVHCTVLFFILFNCTAQSLSELHCSTYCLTVLNWAGLPFNVLDYLLLYYTKLYQGIASTRYSKTQTQQTYICVKTDKHNYFFQFIIWVLWTMVSELLGATCISVTWQFPLDIFGGQIHLV